jgi:hypothetical protein
VVAPELAEVGVDALVLDAGLFVLAAPVKTDEPTVNPIIKRPIPANTPRAAVFHQSRGFLVLITLFIVILLFSSTLRARRMLLLE